VCGDLVTRMKLKNYHQIQTYTTDEELKYGKLTYLGVAEKYKAHYIEQQTTLIKQSPLHQPVYPQSRAEHKQWNVYQTQMMLRPAVTQDQTLPSSLGSCCPSILALIRAL